jgi:hypothetical protein
MTLETRKRQIDDARAIKVWAFEDAPKELRDLSINGGDEDWLALIPPTYDMRYGLPIWMQVGSFSTEGEPDVFDLPDGSKVVIGSHA